ncbi:MAG: hypothetical protein FJX76_14945 [Armatimonadetes bacterium]|nr:hypothetical protein [Armatimonadota bacterium]
MLDRLFALADAYEKGEVSRDDYAQALASMQAEVAHAAEALANVEAPATLIVHPEVSDLYASLAEALGDLDVALQGMREGQWDRVRAAIGEIRVLHGRMETLMSSALGLAEREAAREGISLRPEPAGPREVVYSYKFCCQNCAHEFVYEAEGVEGELAIDLEEVMCPKCGWQPG